MQGSTLLRARHVLSGLVLFSLMSVISLASPTLLYAAGTTKDTKVKINVDPVDCVVDVVEDGNGQSLQIPAHSCLPVVPTILTPILDQGPSPLVPSEDDAPVPVIIIRSTPTAGSWSPVATAGDDQTFFSTTGLGTVPTMIVGMGIVTAGTAIGVDAALFEMSHSRSVARWARMRLTPRLRP